MRDLDIALIIHRNITVDSIYREEHNLTTQKIVKDHFKDLYTKRLEGKVGYSLFKVILNKEQRSLAENKALHLWFSWISAELNERGLGVKVTFNGETKEYPATPTRVKNKYKEILLFKTGLDSTTKLSRGEATQYIDDEGNVHNIIDDLCIEFEAEWLPPFPSENETVENYKEKVEK